MRANIIQRRIALDNVGSGSRLVNSPKVTNSGGDKVLVTRGGGARSVATCQRRGVHVGAVAVGQNVRPTLICMDSCDGQARCAAQVAQREVDVTGGPGVAWGKCWPPCAGHLLGHR